MTSASPPPIPAKILLFGEHTVLRGSEALAMPLWSRSCHWQQDATAPRQGGLINLLTYLKEQFADHFDLKAFEEDLDAGWYLESNIPVGYGLGSSAAVCVGVFERYATAIGQLALSKSGTRAYFAQMESHFHGTSSGTDPLIIYERQSVLLSPESAPQLVAIPSLPGRWQFFLLDTRKSRETAPFVNYFTRRYDSDTSFQSKTDTKWIPANDAAISALLTGNMDGLQMAFRDISEFQLTELPPMVLPALHEVWQTGLNSRTYSLKICGAGGGGYCLGLTQDWEQTQQLIRDWPLERIDL